MTIITTRRSALITLIPYVVRATADQLSSSPCIADCEMKQNVTVDTL